MAEWTDGRERSNSYLGSPLDLAIREYFEDHNQEERLGLKWDNEAMRRELNEAEQEKVAAAGA